MRIFFGNEWKVTLIVMERIIVNINKVLTVKLLVPSYFPVSIRNFNTTISLDFSYNIKKNNITSNATCVAMYK